MIYAISTDDVPDYPIWIGHSDKSPNSILAAMQPDSPYTLKILFEFAGDATSEAAWRNG
jgi:hypothetical protein